jgi:curli production assembly/transport component CsgE
LVLFSRLSHSLIKSAQMRLPRLTAAIVLALSTPVVLAAPGAEQDRLAGTVTDQTITVAGHEFYKNFCAAWHDQALGEMFSLAVRELASARRGNQILVDYAGRTVFQAALPANRGNIRPLSERAVELTHAHMSNVELARMLLRDPDLGSDEF